MWEKEFIQFFTIFHGNTKRPAEEKGESTEKESHSTTSEAKET